MANFKSFEEIERRVAALSERKVRHIVASIVGIMYGEGADEDWGADTTESIVGVLVPHGLVPKE